MDPKDFKAAKITLNQKLELNSENRVVIERSTIEQSDSEK